LFYTDFKGHIGYKTFAVGQPMSSKKVSVKMEGYTAEFGLEKNDGQIIFWLIPTGEPGFAFWNVTAKCALIGRKYLIKDHE
jgi:hypothetical protein